MSKLQKWGIRAATNSRYNAHTEPLYKIYNILKLDDLYKLKMFNLVRQCVDDTAPDKMTDMFEYHSEKNRIKYYLTQRKPVSKVVDSLPYFKIPIEWNKAKFTDIFATTKTFTNNHKKSVIDSYSFSCFIKKCYNCQPQTSQ